MDEAAALPASCLACKGLITFDSRAPDPALLVPKTVIRFNFACNSGCELNDVVGKRQEIGVKTGIERGRYAMHVSRPISGWLRSSERSNFSLEDRSAECCGWLVGAFSTGAADISGTERDGRLGQESGSSD